MSCDVLRGFEPGMSPDEARSRHGAPSGESMELGHCDRAYYYDVPDGRVSICLVADSGAGHWVTIGYPKRSDCEDVVLNAAVLAQLEEIRGNDDEIYFELETTTAHAWRGLGLHVKGDKCESVSLYGSGPWMDEASGRAAERRDTLAAVP